jgi:hypothetical protein
LEFYNYVTSANEFWFATVSPTSTSGLGIDFGIFREAEHASALACPSSHSVTLFACHDEYVSDDLAALTALCGVRTSDLVPLMQRLEGPIQKPDTDPVMPSA